MPATYAVEKTMTDEHGTIRARSGPLLHALICAGRADTAAAETLRRRLLANRIAATLMTPDQSAAAPPTDPFVLLALLSHAGSIDTNFIAGVAGSRPAPVQQLLLTLDDVAIPEVLADWERFEPGAYRGLERLMRHLWSIISRGHRNVAAPANDRNPGTSAEPELLTPGFQGTIRLPQLEQAGQLRRLGRGRPLQAWPLNPRFTLVVAGGGAALFDIRDQHCCWEIDAPVQCAALSHNGQRLALAGEQIWFWDIEQGRLLSTLNPPAGLTRCLAFRPGNDVLVSGTDTGNILFWRSDDPAHTIAPFAVLQAHRQAVQHLVFAPNGRILASCAADHRLRLWDTLDRSLLNELPHSQANPTCLAFHPEHDLLVTGAGDHIIRFWQFNRKLCLAEWPGPETGLACLAFHPQGAALAAGYANGRLALWPIADLPQQFAMPEANRQSLPAGVRTLNFSSSGDQLAIVLRDQRIQIRQSLTLEPLAELQQHVAAVSSLAFSRDGRTLAAGYADGRLLIRSFVDRNQKVVFSGHSARIIDLGFSEDGTMLTTLSQDRSIRAWLSANGRQQQMLALHSPVHCGACARQAGMVAIAAGDGVVRLRQASGEPAGRLRGPDSRIEVLASDPAGRFIAAGTGDGQLWLWEAGKSGSHMGGRRLGGHRDRLRSLAFASSSKLLASSDERGQLRIWRPSDGRCLHEHRPTNLAVTALAFSPDGNGLAAGDQEGNLWIWRQIHDKAPLCITAHAGIGHCLEYAPDGSALASGSSDGTVRIWALPA
jgi:WD40 repeat protein